jgi:hypothetical protein
MHLVAWGEMVKYSLIPGTGEWDAARHVLQSDDPLWHNNSLLALVAVVERSRIQELKSLVRRLYAAFS